MKLQIMSDLHFEMHVDGGAELIRELDPAGVDVFVLAGDITTGRSGERIDTFHPLTPDLEKAVESARRSICLRSH